MGVREFLPQNGRAAVCARLMLMGEAHLFCGRSSAQVPFVSRPQPNLFYQMTIDNAQGFTVDSFFSSIDSLHHTDLRKDISRITMPAMGIYGARDVIVNPNQHKLFDKYIPHGKTVVLKKAGHFPMWDTPKEFNAAFQQFMDVAGGCRFR
jgi:pimeloyl-ACP methyl ester carboxylesterase